VASEVVASWLSENDRTLIPCESLPTALAEAGADSGDPIVIVLKALGAELHIVAGDTAGTVLLWYPPGSERDGRGSLHSVGDAEAAASDQWEPIDFDEARTGERLVDIAYFAWK
jgi:hypothetical protein